MEAQVKKDIESGKDIKWLIDHFYEEVKKDPVIGYIFNEVIELNWGKHLPVMYSFWENTLFYTGSYTGNPMIKHQHIHEITPLRAEHFDRWTTLFIATIDNYFTGEKADLAKQRALSIAEIMKIKILS